MIISYPCFDSSVYYTLSGIVGIIFASNTRFRAKNMQIRSKVHKFGHYTAV